MKILIITFLILFTSVRAFGQKDSGYTVLAISQGISMPAITTPVNWGHGFTYNNSAVARNYDGALLSVEYDQNENAKGYGAELGVGTGNVGLGIGYYKNDCDNCDGRVGAIAGFGMGRDSSFGIGYREEKTYSAGLLFGLGSSGQLGIAVDFRDNEDKNLKTYSYGIGYAYSSNSFKFAIDASKQEDGDSSTDNSLIMLTPGLMVDGGVVRLGISFDTYLNDKNETHEDKAWFGIGFGNNSKWNLNIYKDYSAEYSAALTFWF
ncbi:MAG: hypothetical protein K0R29_2387 [Pseudobdellovibrio sp.]|nr:hypothetical protein [Pseudobdellovibrio sp.]